jgi:hypothetical protein
MMVLAALRYLVVGEMEGAVMVAFLVYRLMTRRHDWREGMVAALRWLWYGVWGLAGLAALNLAPWWGFVALLLILGIPVTLAWMKPGLGEDAS